MIEKMKAVAPLTQENIHSLQDLQTLFAQNKETLDPESQRLFHAIILELNKGDRMDGGNLAKMIEALGARAGLQQPRE